MIVASQLTECREGSSTLGHAHCQPYRLECDLKPGAFFNAFNCSVAITAYVDSCIELHPPVDICHQITINLVIDGVEAEANGGLINATVCSCGIELFFWGMEGERVEFVSYTNLS